MSTTLLVAGVSALLKTQLENGLVTQDVSHAIGGDAIVTLLPPNRVKTGGDERAQINLFLYQIGTRGIQSSSRFRLEVETRPDLPPPPVELGYLLTAYGAQDYQSEILLGIAQQTMHERPIIMASEIARALANLTIGGGMTSASASALSRPEIARAYKSVQITPQTLTLSDLQHLWAMLQAPFRVSLCYKVLVLSEAALEKQSG